MANAYGTKAYEEYVEEYRSIREEYARVITNKIEEHFETNGIRFDFVRYWYDIYENAEDDFASVSTESAEITVTRQDGQSRTYHTIDDVMKPQVFSVRGADYIFFRKALYGYCIVDLRDFSEYNYFPSAVLEDGEAFISTAVYGLHDLLIIEGCYWAVPYEICVLDTESKKSIRLKDCPEFRGPAGLLLEDNGVRLYDDGFGVTDGMTGTEYRVDYAAIRQRIAENGSADL